MRIGDIKKEALKLMFVSYTDDLGSETVEELWERENYRPYLLGMTGAINRCLSDIENRRVLPVRSYVPERSRAQVKRSSARFDLSALLPDFFDVCRVIAEGDCTYDGDHPYFMEGETLVLRGMDADTDYTLLYYPKIRRLAENVDNASELADVPEEIAVLIPYFIKGDLYREDEPNEAGEARNWYESGMAALLQRRSEKQGRVATVYSQVDA